jgi:hypothetical protein
VALHCVVLLAAMFGFSGVSMNIAALLVQHHSVRLLQPGILQPTASYAPPQQHSGEPIQEKRAGEEELPPSGGPSKTEIPAVQRARFELPPPPPLHSAEPTPVLPDAPQSIVSNYIQLPAALLGAQTVLPPRFELPPPPPLQSAEPALVRPDAPPSIVPNDIQVPAAPLGTQIVLPQPAPSQLVPPAVNDPANPAQPLPFMLVPEPPNPGTNTAGVESLDAFFSLTSVPGVRSPADGLGVWPPTNQIAAGSHAGPELSAGNSGPELSDGHEGAVSGGGENSPRATLTRLTRPADGRFDVIVLGSSISDFYPESAGLMPGTPVYTAYLRVGTRKSWIMQYCLPQVSRGNVTSDERAAPLDPPWPVVIIRPDLSFAPDSVHLTVHGIINSSGHFEELSLISPDRLTDKGLLLGALQQWEFRPATQAGQPIGVAVLLIIPRVAE